MSSFSFCSRPQTDYDECYSSTVSTRGSPLQQRARQCIEQVKQNRGIAADVVLKGLCKDSAAGPTRRDPVPAFTLS